MPVKDGDYVLINYTIRVIEDPEKGVERVYETTVEEVAKEAGIYDEKRGYRPIWVKVDRETLLDAVYEAILGMEKGEKKTIEASPEKAYGEYRRDLVVRIPVKRLRSRGITPRVGERLKINGQEGVITRVTDRFAYVDFNHPLAGKRLRIDIEVLDIAENDLQLAQGIASTLFRLGKTSLNIKVEEDDGKLIVTLPPDVILIDNLEVLLRIFLEQIYEKTKYDKVEIRATFEFKRKEEEGGEEKEFSTAPAEEGQESE